MLLQNLLVHGAMSVFSYPTNSVLIQYVQSVLKFETNCLKQSFCYSGTKMWSSLSQEMRKLQSLFKFKEANNKYFND